MLLSFRTVAEEGYSEIVIKKSRFLCRAKQVKSEEEASAFIDGVKALHKDANHTVSAYIIGDFDQFKKASDDGEPQGTAGQPVLKVMEREGFQYTAVTVTRYFGGIKLGANGLVRAYAEGAKAALMASKPCRKILSCRIMFDMEYTLLGKMQNECSNREFHMETIDYGEKVTVTMLIDKTREEEFCSFLLNITQGKAKPVIMEEIYRTELETIQDTEEE